MYREDHGRGGGVCFYVKDYFKVTELDSGVDKQQGIEAKWLSVQLRYHPSFIIGCFYRHPKAQADSFSYISESFKSIILRNKQIIIFGDFNDDLLKVENKMSKIVRDLKLIQLVNTPTRIVPNSATLLDLVITNNSEIIRDLEVIPGPVADHEAIVVSMNISKPKRLPIVKTFRSHQNYSSEILCNMLLNEIDVLNEIVNTDNVNHQVDILTNAMYKCIDSSAPIVTKEVRRPPAPWLSIEVKQLMKERDDTQKALKIDKFNVSLREKYKDQKKNVKRQIDSKRRQFYREEFEKNRNNITSTWKTAKKMLNCDSNKSLQISGSNKELKNKADNFNEFFAEVGKKNV